ncbi:hypothetical protein [Noviherbaspirillum pedocola]|nr:hypothetical protein [Noviherbaspirillum pedocola]
MFSRVREVAMRLSLIVAVSDGKDAIEASHAQWAIDFAQYWADRAISELIAKIADTPFAALRNEVAEHVMKAGLRGLTHAELARKSARFKGADMKLRNSVFEVLTVDQDMRWVTYPSRSGRARPRIAFVHVPKTGDEDDS